MNPLRGLAHELQNELKTSVMVVKESVTSARDNVTALQERVDRLVLINIAMWELLSEKLGMSEDQLIDKIGEIDLRDGLPDGKLKVATCQTCPKCGKTMSTRHRRCLYCGCTDLTTSPFNSI